MASQRLDSLDALRGLDMFILVLLHPVIMAMAGAMPDSPVVQFLGYQSSHVAWEGFTVHDLIMPLFMFVAGVAIPFSMAKYRRADGVGFDFDRRRVYLRMARRVAMLWILGMVIQGNLLGFDLHSIRLFSNTLQAIAVGYLFASLLYINMSWRWQTAVVVALMVIYWAVMTFCGGSGWGIDFHAGSYTFPDNMAEYVDRAVLGRFRDGVAWSGESWNFASWYDTTWILSSLTFVVTVTTGVLAGEILLMSHSRSVALRRLLVYGVGMLLVAWMLSYEIPVIKRIWTPSMVLLSSGISVLLLAALYYVMDIRGAKRWAMPLRVMGMNAIAAYTIGEYFNFSAITGRVLYGLEQLSPELYPVVIALGNALLIYWIVWMMYRCGKFVKI